MANNNIYGIDLGTTYSCIAYVDEHNRPTVIPNNENQLTTPSVVWFETEDNVVVGEAAKEMTHIESDRVFSTVKRVMGQPGIEFVVDDKSLTAPEISSYILRKLVKDAEQNLGEEIKNVVITCPAYFGLNQKEATKQAGEIAGLNVLHVIPEPTAAAIAYGMEQEEDQVILVFDLGGGTFDITLIEVSDSAIRVISTGGDDKLGGKNWDETIANHFADRFAQEVGGSADELTHDMETWQELLSDAEKCKMALSSRQSYTQQVRFGTDKVRLEISREEFDDLTRPHLERAFSLTEDLIEKARTIGHEKIDLVLMVGGSTYMPQVQEGLQERFDIPSRSFDPNQVVAKGAAIFGYKAFLEEAICIEVAAQSGQDAEDIDISQISEEDLELAAKKVAETEGLALPGMKKLIDKKIVNVSSKSFGLVVVDTFGEEKVANLIQKDDQVPVSVTQVYGTHEEGQQSAELRLIENEQIIDKDDLISLPDDFPDEESGLKEIANAVIEFERPLPKGSRIEVGFNLEPDGRLMMTGKDLTTGAEAEVTLETECILSKEELEAAKSRSLAVDVV